MRHSRSVAKLSRTTSHRKALMSNMAASLVRYGRIKTTIPKAKALRPFLERLVTKARSGGLHSVRTIGRRLRDKQAVSKLVNEIGPRYVGRNGGYLRIVRIGFRPSDFAEMSVIEFV